MCTEGGRATSHPHPTRGPPVERREASMKYRLVLPAALVAGMAGLTPVQAQQGIDLVKQAVAAQGGAQALRGLKAISITADGQHWEPGQSYAPGGEARFLGDSAI